MIVEMKDTTRRSELSIIIVRDNSLIRNISCLTGNFININLIVHKK